jgi:hypothetical protein
MGPVGLRHPRHHYLMLMDEAVFRGGAGISAGDGPLLGGGGGGDGNGGGGGGGGEAASAIGPSGALAVCVSGRRVKDGEIERSSRLVAVGAGEPRMKLVGQAGALAALVQATVAPISHVAAETDICT